LILIDAKYSLNSPLVNWLPLSVIMRLGTPKRHQPTDEFDGRPGRNRAHQVHLCPLGELIDGDVEVAIAPLHSREWSQDVQPPNNKGPSEWDGLQLLRRLMDLLGMDFARLTPLDHLSSIRERRRPVEATAICFPGEHAG
jgi:hypothetical protein